MRVGHQATLRILGRETREQRQGVGIALEIDERLREIERRRPRLGVVRPGREEIAQALDRGLRPAQLQIAQRPAVRRVRRQGRGRILPHHVVVRRPCLGEAPRAIERFPFPEAPLEPLRRRRHRLEAAKSIERLLGVAHREPCPSQQEQRRRLTLVARVVGDEALEGSPREGIEPVGRGLLADEPESIGFVERERERRGEGHHQQRRQRQEGMQRARHDDSPW